MLHLILPLCAILATLSDTRAQPSASSSGALASLGTGVADPLESPHERNYPSKNNSVSSIGTNRSNVLTWNTPAVAWLAQSEYSDADIEAFVRAAIVHWIANDQHTTTSIFDEATGQWETRPIEQYQSVDEFLSSNPDCCSFGVKDPDGYRPGFWYRVRNEYVGIVTIPRIRRVFADTGEVSSMYGRGYAIDRDGQVINGSYWVD